MSGYTRLPGGSGPPGEAYSRVTNPERFQPLHEAALRLLERLRIEFAVEMSEGYDLCDLGVSRERMTRPPIKLSPNDTDCAPVTVVFDDFLGVRVRIGKWKEDRFPDCDCDACDEDADEEIARMTRMFESVIAGGFIEAIRIPPEATWIPSFLGDGWVGSALSGPGMPVTESERAVRPGAAKRPRRLAKSKVFRDGLRESVLASLGSISGRRVERSRALEMTGGRLYLEFDWKPWSRRRQSPNGESEV